MKTAEEINQITEAIIGAAIAVHKALGRGLLNPPTKPAWFTS